MNANASTMNPEPLTLSPTEKDLHETKMETLHCFAEDAGTPT